MSAESGSQNGDFLALGGEYAVVGNRTEPVLRILCLEDHRDTQTASYDPRAVHSEARVSADGETVMLFGYREFQVYDRQGALLSRVDLPDAEAVYDQQFVRAGEESWLEVIWYDGTRRFYDAADGNLIGEEQGEAPSEDLYEEFSAGPFRIASGLHDAPVVYDKASGRKLAVLEGEGYLTYVTEAGEYLVTEYIDASGGRYGLLLNRKLETLAYLPGLCDVTEEGFVFDNGVGSLRLSRLYSLEELVALGRERLAGESARE